MASSCVNRAMVYVFVSIPRSRPLQAASVTIARINSMRFTVFLLLVKPYDREVVLFNDDCLLVRRRCDDGLLREHPGSHESNVGKRCFAIHQEKSEHGRRRKRNRHPCEPSTARTLLRQHVEAVIEISVSSQNSLRTVAAC